MLVASGSFLHYYRLFGLLPGRLFEAGYIAVTPKEAAFHVNGFAVQSQPQGFPTACAPAKAPTEGEE